MIDYNISADDVQIRQGDIVMVDEPQATRQRLEQKLRLWQGEWFLNTGAGFPWLSEILGKRPRPEVVRSLIFDLVTTDPGVKSIDSLSVEFDPQADRQLRIAFNATLSSGATDPMEINL